MFFSFLALLLSQTLAQYSPELSNFVNIQNFSIVNALEVDYLRQSIYIAGQSDSGYAVLGKYTYQGLLEWTVFVGTGSGETFEGVTVDSPTGDVYASGITSDVAFDNQTLVGFINNFMCRFDSEGEKIWTRIFGSANYDKNVEVRFDKYRNQIIVLSLDDEKGAISVFSPDGNLTQRVINDTITNAQMQADPSIELYKYSDIIIDENLIYLSGNIETYYDLSSAIFAYDGNLTLVWKKMLDESAYTVAYGLARDPDNLDILYLCGTTSSQFYESTYDYYANTGGNAYALAFNVTNQTHIWAKQWERGMQRVQMAAMSAQFANGLLYLAEYALSRGPAFVTTFDRNASTQNSLQVRYSGWQFATAVGIRIVATEGVGFAVGSYGKLLPNTGYLLAFNLYDSYVSKKKVVDFGEPWATTIPTSIPPVTVYSTDSSIKKFARTLLPIETYIAGLSGGAIAGIVIGNLILLVGSILGVFFVGRHYHIKKLRAQMEQRRQMMLQMQQSGNVPGASTGDVVLPLGPNGTNASTHSVTAPNPTI